VDFLAHGGTGGLLIEVLPVLGIGVIWLVVWRRSKRADAAASDPAGPRDEAGVEQDRSDC
jgi:hypothetical protein